MNNIDELEKRAKEYLKERGMQGGIGGSLIPELLASFAQREIKNLIIPDVIKSCKDPDVLSGNKHCNICSGDGCRWYR